jgi:membrane protein
VAVLLWIGVSAFAVLAGAAVNAAIDRVWPSVATAAAREANERVREEAAAELIARAAAQRAARARGEDVDGVDGDWDESMDWPDTEPPSEFPERWAQFLPPDDIRSRLHAKRERGEGDGSPGKESAAEGAGHHDAP